MNFNFLNKPACHNHELASDSLEFLSHSILMKGDFNVSVKAID